MASEIDKAKRWLANTLMNDGAFPAALLSSGSVKKVYVDHADRSLGFPYVLISMMSAIDRPGLGIARVQTQADFQVRVVTEGPPTATSESIVNWMDALIQSKSAQPAEGYFISCRRQAPIDRAEYGTNQQRYHNAGGVYRLFIHG